MIYLAYYNYDKKLTHVVAKEKIHDTDKDYVKIEEELYNNILNAMASGCDEIIVLNDVISILENKQLNSNHELEL